MRAEPHTPTTSSVPLLVPSAGFLATVALMQSEPIGDPVPFVWILVASIASLAAILRRWTVLALLIGVISGATVVIASTDEDTRRVRALIDRGLVKSDEPVELMGWVKGVPNLFPGGFGFELATDGITTPRMCAPASGKVAFRVRSNRVTPGISSGDRIRVACFPRREEMFRNPGGFSYVGFMDAEGIDAMCSLKSELLVETTYRNVGGIPRLLGEFRNEVGRRFVSNLGPLHGGIVVAVTLGNKDFLDGRAADLFRRGGTFHLLIISGLHMTFLAGLILLLITFLTGSRWAHFFIVTPVIWTYVEIVGWDRPVVRACLMFTLILFGRCLNRRPDPLNLILATAMISLAMHPPDIFSPSFQLTFLSVVAITSIGIPLIDRIREIGQWTPDSSKPFPPAAGILRSFAETVYWNPRAWELRSRGNNWKGSLVKHPFVDLTRHPVLMRMIARVFEGIAVTLALQIALLPLQIALFHRVTPAGPLLNLVIAPVIAVQALASVFSISIAVLAPELGNLFSQIAVLVGDIGIWISGKLLDSGFDDLRMPVYKGLTASVYFIHLAFMIAVVHAFRVWNPFSRSPAQRIPVSVIVAALTATSLLMIFTPLSSPRPDGKLRIDFLDVGQGDSTFIVFPNGETMLVDAGGMPTFADKDSTEEFVPDSMRIGEAVVSEFLWDAGYSKIDHILATHSHADHIQGIREVISNFSVGMIYLGEMKSDSQEYGNLVKTAEQRGVRMERAFVGDSMQIAGVRVEVLNPPRGVREISANEGSLVVRITYGKRRILLTGDIESSGEAFVASQRDIRADVVKVAHHGSRTSSSEEFVKRVDASYAVIPVGRRSRFGHPHREVVDRWRRSGAKVMTTGNGGTITVITDGRDLSVSSFID